MLFCHWQFQGRCMHTVETGGDVARTRRHPEDPDSDPDSRRREKRVRSACVTGNPGICAMTCTLLCAAFAAGNPVQMRCHPEAGCARSRGLRRIIDEANVVIYGEFTCLPMQTV